MYSQKGLAASIPAAKFADIMAQRMVPFTGDPLMMDYSDGPTGIYSIHKAKQVAWDRHYTRFWKESILYCDQSHMFPSFIEFAKAYEGFTPEAEPLFFNAVTGKNITFSAGDGSRPEDLESESSDLDPSGETSGSGEICRVHA